MLNCKYPIGIASPVWGFDSDQIVVFITQKKELNGAISSWMVWDITLQVVFFH